MDGSRFPDPPCPLPQHPAMAAALREIGARVERTETAAGRATVLRRGPLRLVSRGPVWNPGVGAGPRAAAFRSLARGGPLIVNAETAEDAAALAAAGFGRLLTPAHLAELPLFADPDAQRAALAGSWRNRLRRAEAAGLTVANRPFRPACDGWLLAAEAAQRRAARYRALPLALVPALDRALSGSAEGAVRVLSAHARPGGPALAGVLILRHGAAATYHIGWSGPEGRAAQAHALLLWRAMTWLARQGAAMLDLGAVDGDAAPGQMRYKLGTGAAVRALGGTWARLIPPWR